MKFFKHLIVSIFAFIYLTLEYFLWNTILEPTYQKLKNLRPYRRLLIWIREQHKYLVLFIFLLFFIFSEVLGVVALAFLADGLILFFVIMYIVKFIPVAIAFTVLDNSKEALLSIKWFSVIYFFVMKIIDILKNSKLFIKTQEMFEIVKTKVAGYLKNLKLTLK